MKKTRMTAFAAAAIAASIASASVTAFADDTLTDFSDTVETNDSGWSLTEKGIKLLNDDISAGGKIYTFGVSLKKKIDESIVLHFDFYAGNGVYGLDYILMFPLYSAEDEDPTIYLFTDDVVNALIDRYSEDDSFDFAKIDGMKLSDMTENIKDLELTDKKCAPRLAGHVWRTFGKDDNGEFTEEKDYYIFDADGDSGRTVDPASNTGAPFSYEQDGEQFLMSFGGVDDQTPVTIRFGKNGEIIGDFAFGDDASIIREYLFKPVMGEDPETFGITDLYPSQEEGKWMLVDPSTKLFDANGTAGGNVGMLIKFKDMLLDGFDLEFIFVTNDGKTVTVPARSDAQVDSDTLFMNVRSLLNKADVDVDKVTDFYVSEGTHEIKSINFGMKSNDSVQILFSMPAENEPVSDNDGENPATGASTALGYALAAGTAALLSRRRHDR